MKESIFNVLAFKIPGSIILDLFAGSGSLGIEAISRGAKMVYFVDDSLKSVNLIKDNIAVLKNLEKNYKILKSDVIKFIKSNQELCPDIIFIDPPYKIAPAVMEELFAAIKNTGIAVKKTEIVYEYFFKRDISNEIYGFKIKKNSFFGDKIVSYISI